MSDKETTSFLRRLIADVTDENVDLKVKLAKMEQERIRLLLRIDALTEMDDERTIEEFVAKHDTDVERYITSG